MDPLKLGGMLRFGCAIGFHMSFQVCFSAETTRAMRAPAQLVHVAFFGWFFGHCSNLLSVDSSFEWVQLVNKVTGEKWEKALMKQAAFTQEAG
jgi:hypothetical protein